MSRKSKKGLTKNQKLVAIAILGLDENGRRRTQSEVSDVLAMAKSTVSEAVRALIDGGYLMESGKSARDKFYARGPNFALLESQLTDEIYDSMRNLRSVQRTRTPGSQADRSGPSDTPREVNAPELEHAWEVHAPGAGFMFGVEMEGNIERTSIQVADPQTGEPRQVWQKIFTQPSYDIDGSRNWSDVFVLGQGARFTIRYMKTVNGVRRFFVSPQHEILVSPQVAQDYQAILHAFVSACTPMLIWLEKNAGWRFTKDDRGMYALLSDIPEQSIHKAMRGPLNDLVTGLTGGAFAGNDELWADDSPGYTELETNQPAYIEAILDLPQTRQRVNSMFAEWPALKVDLAKLREDVDTLAYIVHRIYEINCDLAQITANTQRRMAVNQTTFDQYPMADEVAPSGKPPEGYQ